MKKNNIVNVEEEISKNNINDENTPYTTKTKSKKGKTKKTETKKSKKDTSKKLKNKKDKTQEVQNAEIKNEKTQEVQNVENEKEASTQVKTKKRKRAYKKPKPKAERMKTAIKIKKILIGNRLKQIRKSTGLTQEQVAKKLGLAPRYISDIERDKTKGSLDTLVKLCNIYNVSPSFILKDYIKISDNDFINDSLTGYNTLSDYEKELIIELIHFMNSKKLKQ